MNPLDAYRDVLALPDFAQLEAAIRRPLLPAIRINTLKVGVEEARQTWPEWYGWRVQPVPFCDTGWQIAYGENLSRTLEHRMGFYYIQEAASMLPAEMFRLEQLARPLILDLAASPGGKTTHLACRINDTGLIIANDTSQARIGALRSNLQTWGAINVAVTNFPGERFGSWFPDTFDLVLLDAPCSGESLRTSERRRPRPVSVKEREQLHRRQVRLLTRALSAAKPGGQIVYATCTLAPEENEAVLDALLKAYPQQAEVLSIDHALPRPAPGLTSHGAREFAPQVRRAARLWPHLFDTSGFFAALIGKRDSVASDLQTPPSRTLAQAGLERVKQPELAKIYDQLQQGYGFDLAALIERQRLSLWQRHKAVYAIPEQFLARFADFSCSAVGMMLGEIAEDFAPSHAFAARFGGQFTGRRFRLEGDYVGKWLAGYDLREIDEAPYPAGTVIILEDGRRRYLGRGKVLRDRIRNLLPKR